VQVKETISWVLPPWVPPKVGKVNVWGQVSRAKAQSLQKPRGGTVNDCMIPTALTAQEKQRSFWSNREGRCKAFVLNGVWGGNGVAPGVAPNPTVGTSQRRGARQLFAAGRTPLALAGATPGATGSRSMLRVPGSQI